MLAGGQALHCHFHALAHFIPKTAHETGRTFSSPSLDERAGARGSIPCLHGPAPLAEPALPSVEPGSCVPYLLPCAQGSSRQRPPPQSWGPWDSGSSSLSVAANKV